MWGNKQEINTNVVAYPNYFCTFVPYLKDFRTILALLCLLPIAFIQGQNATEWQVEEVITDIYYQLTETGETESEDLQTMLLEIAAHPFNINQITEEQLLTLRFLGQRQIDAVLAYVDRHPLVSLEELYLISELQEWDVRNLQAFVYVGEAQKKDALYFREVFQQGKHEILTRLDVRNAENFSGDPIYIKGKYAFNYKNRVQFGATLQREPGGDASSLGYGGYIQLNNLGVVKSVVAGNFQACFGQGLVLSNPFHTGKNNYVLTAGMQNEGIKKYSSVDGNGLHGIGTTLAFEVGKNTLSATVLYSLTKPDEDLRRHSIGANFTWQYNRLKIGVTALENIYSDTLTYYRDMNYNRNYFRGTQQAVIGLNGRYNWGRVDLFGEVATAQNQQWGFAANIGARITPIDGVGLTALYRYYSPMFDNVLGYGFSESNRINDENGGYIGWEVSRLSHWVFSGYGDVFYCTGYKYGVNYFPSIGYDIMAQAQWHINRQSAMLWKIRARQKAKKDTYSLRYQYNWTDGRWTLHTEANANLVADSLRQISWGVTLHQDVQYAFATSMPVVLQGRLLLFHAPNWDNRVYTYENDVLYGYSVPAIYGQGVRMYLNLRWKIIDQLSLYFRISETIYAKNWAIMHDKPQSDTDLHLLLRATL